jgi:hypothetical protein
LFLECAGIQKKVYSSIEQQFLEAESDLQEEVDKKTTAQFLGAILAE